MNAHPAAADHNWLVHRITTQSIGRLLPRYARGVLVDIGCGVKPYAILTKGLVTEHIGVDHAQTEHNVGNIDVFASSYDTTLPDASADTVLCTFVLEHLERPQDAIREMYRILKPNGHLILGAPLFWHLHEEPRDFYRYTKYGLEYLFVTAGLEVVEIEPLGGFIVTFAQELCYFLNGRGGKAFRYPVRLMQNLLQTAAFKLHSMGRDRQHRFTWAYTAVGKKAASNGHS